jgi:hypothetical protein
MPQPSGLSDDEFAANLVALLDAHLGEGDFVVRRLGEEFRAHALDSICGKAPAVVLPFDRLFEHRVSSALRLWRVITGRQPGGNMFTLSAERRKRLILALRALDGRLDDASYREIAETLFGGDAVPERGWKTHELRDRTVRLVRYGFSMMQGGYRQLLLHPFRRRK